MRKQVGIMALFFVLLCSTVCIALGSPDRSVNELIVCGREEVYILDLGDTKDGVPKKVWSWKAQDCADIPTEAKCFFRWTDDCKPIDGGKNILISSSGGWEAGSGVAIVSRETGRAEFYCRGDNVHSADVLPNNRVAIACSGGEHGDCLMIVDRKMPARELYRCELEAGHGVVWDEKRQILWGLSTWDIREYKLKNWNSSHPSLKLISKFELRSLCRFIPLDPISALFDSARMSCWHDGISGTRVVTLRSLKEAAKSNDSELPLS